MPLPGLAYISRAATVASPGRGNNGQEVKTQARRQRHLPKPCCVSLGPRRTAQTSRGVLHEMSLKGMSKPW